MNPLPKQPNLPNMNDTSPSLLGTHRPIAMLFFVMGLAASCQQAENASQPSAEASASIQAKEVNVSVSELDVPVFHDLLEVVLDMKTPMSEDDPVETDAMIERALSILDRTDGEWARVLRSDFEEMKDAGSLDRKRIPFESISAAMIFHTRENPPSGESLYVHSCPMVRNGSADWLSREKEILNPYHGDRMLHCGMIKDEIAAAS